METIAEKKKEYYFASDAFTELTLHIKSGGWREIDGRAMLVNGEAIRFIRKPFRGRPHGRGEFKTTSAKEAEYIRNHEFFKQGKIVELDYDPDTLERELHEAVVSGAKSTGARNVPNAPADSSPEPVKVKIGLSKPKK